MSLGEFKLVNGSSLNCKLILQLLAKLLGQTKANLQKIDYLIGIMHITVVTKIPINIEKEICKFIGLLMYYVGLMVMK